MSKSLRLLTKNEQIARFFFERIAHSLIFLQNNEQFAQKNQWAICSEKPMSDLLRKTDERIPNPGVELNFSNLKFKYLQKKEFFNKTFFAC